MNQRGITLMEVIISVVLLALCSVYVLRALSTISHAQRTIETQNSAYEFLLTKMAELDVEVVKDPMKRIGGSGSFRYDGIKYEWSVGSTIKDALPDLKTVTLLMDWDQGRHNYARMLEVYVPNPLKDVVSTG